MPVSFFKTFVQVGAWSVIAFLVLPLLVVVPISLTDTSYIGLPKEQLSLQHYNNYFTDPVWISATWTSIWIGLVVATLSSGLGTAFALGCWFMSSRAALIARWIMIIPILVPPVVQSLGFYKFWVVLGLIDTYTGVILAHTLLGLPYVTISVFASLANLDPNLARASRSLGASLWQTITIVLLRPIAPGVATGFIFAFIVSFDEIVGVLFLTVRRVSTLPKQIWEGIQEDIDPTIAAVATLLVLFTLVITAIGTMRRRV